MRHIPPLNGLRAFEAAGRLGSFTAAGDELGVSPAAISRFVKLLEQRLGTALFVRSANRLRLTTAGQLYSNELTTLFNNMEDLTARVVALDKVAVLTVGVGPTFAVRWLIPRLGQLQAISPATELRFATGGAASPFREDWTCGIELRDNPHERLQSDHLIAADLIPVCSPKADINTRRIENVPAGRLLRVSHAPDDWQRWLSWSGSKDLEPKGPVFPYYAQAIQAAVDGAGVAMGIRPYVDDDLAAGRLIAPFGPAVSKGKSWYLVYRSERLNDPAFVAFRGWIEDAARQSTEGTPQIGG